jgi:hypothetical protein
MFYKFQQNNSGGSFDVNDKLCHVMIIEADTEAEAVNKAEEFGCYWDGVDRGIDCPCCGDRWSKSYLDPIDVERYTTTGMPVSVYHNIYEDTVAEWNKRYGTYEIVKQPVFEKIYSSTEYIGTIRFRDLEEYVQYLADEYGWTTPDTRIFYKDGHIKEIYSKKVEN